MVPGYEFQVENLVLMTIQFRFSSYAELYIKRTPNPEP